MRNNIYNEQVIKRKLILDKFNDMKIDEVILDYLENININIKSSYTNYLIQMIKKVLFDYFMYGQEVTKRIIDDNKDYLLKTYMNNEDIKENIKQLINNSNINKTIVLMTDEINNTINYIGSMGLKKYSYVV